MLHNSVKQWKIVIILEHYLLLYLKVSIFLCVISLEYICCKFNFISLSYYRSGTFIFKGTTTMEEIKVGNV